MPASQAGGARHKKSTTQILPALVCGQARLTRRNSGALQHMGFHMQLPFRMAVAHLQDGGAGQQIGVIIAAVALLARVHGYRYNQHLLRCCFRPGRSKDFQAIGQESTQPIGYRLHTLVLEQMNERAKLTLVATIGNGLNKGRSRQAAGLAKRTGFITRRWRRGELRNAQIFAATGTEGAALGSQLRAAEIADGDAGETQEGAAAQGAGAWK
jgi:hypothetical protein